MLLILLAACAVESSLPAPVLSGEGFYGGPWPDDSRTVDGRLDLADFPRAGEFALVDKYLTVGQQIEGFGNNAPIYVPLDGVPDLDGLPGPEESAKRGAPVLLLDVDPGSPYRGERVPYTWSFREDETDWTAANLLAIHPVWGFPLRPATRYALVIKADWLAQSPEALERHADARFDVVWETLEDLELDPANVALATVFTTQDPTAEMSVIADTIHRDLPMPPMDQQLTTWNETQWYRAYEGTVRVPMWQHGDKPYFSEGGGFLFADSGEPLLAGWEDVVFTFTVPEGEEPAGGWPVVLNAHGTGGDDRSHAEGDTRLVPAAVQARAGLAIFEISQPLHGDRGTGMDPTLVSFNFLNPDSARATMRQGALDQVYLADLLTARQHCFTTDDGRRACTDPTRVAYLGHSQGGIFGAMAAPFWSEAIHAAVLSGAGGGLSVSMLQRDTTEFDINALLSENLDVSLDELDQDHPLVAMVQVLSEVTDPLNYARFWFSEPVDAAAHPVDVLQTEGTVDQYTPPPTIEALAGAAGLPILDDVVQTSEVAVIKDLVGQTLPTSANLRAWDGTDITGGLKQYEGADHFPIFDDPYAAALYQTFLETGIDGTPTLED